LSLHWSQGAVMLRWWPLVLLVGLTASHKPGQNRTPPRRRIDLDDADEMGFELLKGLGSLVTETIDKAGNVLEAVSDTTAGVTGGSVKLVGGAVKGVAGVVEDLGKGAERRVPGGMLLGGALRVMGHATRGVGETVIAVGHIAEDVTAETGKVASETVKSFSKPIKFLSDAAHDRRRRVEGLSAGSQDQGAASGQELDEQRQGLYFQLFPSPDQEPPESSWFHLLLHALVEYIQALFAPQGGAYPLAPHLLLVLGLNAWAQRKFRSKWCLVVLFLATWGYLASVDFTQRQFLASLAEIRSNARLLRSCVSPVSGARNPSPGGAADAEDEVCHGEEEEVWVETESASWLNAVLSDIWRVGPAVATEDSTAPLAHNASTVSSPPVQGGLSNYISSTVLLVLDEILRSSDSKPETIAYASVPYLNLGSAPPLIHTIQTRRPLAADQGSRVVYRVAGEFLAPDFAFGLVLRMSHLEHAVLPTISVKTTNLTVGFSVDVTLEPHPDVPFIDILELSLVEPPTVDLRVQVLENRFLDLVSIPGVSDWLRYEIKASCRPFVHPGRVAVNITQYFIEVEELAQQLRCARRPTPQGTNASAGGLSAAPSGTKVRADAVGKATPRPRRKGGAKQARRVFGQDPVVYRDDDVDSRVRGFTEDKTSVHAARPFADLSRVFTLLGGGDDDTWDDPDGDSESRSRGGPLHSFKKLVAQGHSSIKNGALLRGLREFIIRGQHWVQEDVPLFGALHDHGHRAPTWEEGDDKNTGAVPEEPGRIRDEGHMTAGARATGAVAVVAQDEEVGIAASRDELVQDVGQEDPGSHDNAKQLGEPSSASAVEAAAEITNAVDNGGGGGMESRVHAEAPVMGDTDTKSPPR